MQRVPPWLQRITGGVNNLVERLTGPVDPNLNSQENAARQQQARMAMIGRLLQSTAPRPQGTFSPISDFGAAIMEGQQAGSAFSADAMRTKLMQAQIAQMTQKQTPTYESPIGKLLADRDLAAQRNDAAGVAAIDQAIAKEGGIGGADLAEVLRVRNDITRNSTEFLNAQTGYDKVVAASQSDSPAGDMSLIFGFMKVLDPGSIVKEGEFATVQNSAGIPEQIRGTYNRILRGERLTPEQRQDFTHQARQQFGPMIERQKRLVDDARSFAERNKLPFADIVPEYLKPLLPEAVERPPNRDPRSQLPSLWGQMKKDFEGLIRPDEEVPQPPPGYTLDP